MSQAGVRIRLDLSSFEKVPKKQFRWTYLGYDQFSTVKDVKDYIKANFLPKSEQIKKIRLYLEEPFWIPASESIKILQNGDLILVKTRRDDLANVDESETNGAKKRKLSDPSPSIISNGDVTKRNVALISKPKDNPPSSKRAKGNTSSSGSSSEESSESENEKTKQAPEPIKKGPTLPKGFTPKLAAKLGKEQQSSDESSDSESSGNDDDGPKTVKKVLPSPNDKIVASISKTDIRTSNVDNSIEKKTKKRKRKRQPKNKNKLPATENLTPAPTRNNQEIKPANACIKPANSGPPRPSPFVKKTFSATKHKFFDDEEESETSHLDTAASQEVTSHSLSASPVTTKLRNQNPETSSIRYPNMSPSFSVSIRGSKKHISSHEDKPAAYRYPEVTPTTGTANGQLGQQKPRLVANSAEISCEEAILGMVHSLKPTSLKSVEPNNASISARLPNGNHVNGSPRIDSFKRQNEVKIGVALIPGNHNLGNLLGLAQVGSTLRGSRKRRADVWTNRSVVLENISGPEQEETSEHQDDAESDHHPYGNFQDYPVLSKLPPENSVIAFKILEMSANYTPEFSRYFGGKVLHSGQDTIQVLITFDENDDSEPRNRKFEVDDDTESVSKIGKEFTYRWTELIEPRIMSN